MPWKECKPMDERIRFIGRLLEGEKMAPLCREFGISRVTGYKIFNRYKDCGLDGLNDRSRAPYRQANRLPYQVERTILGIKKEHPSWGARKIRDKLLREFSLIKPPAVSTIHAVLDRHGLVKRKKRRRYKASAARALIGAHAPNGLWCADYKGEFMLGGQALLLSAHHLRLPFPISLGLRGRGFHPIRLCLQHFREGLQGLRPAARDSDRQRCAFRLR